MRIKLGIKLTLSEIAAAVSASYISDKKIGFVSTDSREAKLGDIFIAINGEHHNGESFISEAVSKGAIPLCTTKANSAIYVSSTVNALLQLSAYYKTKLTKLKYTVAITGSVGKTTTKEFLAKISSAKYTTHSTIGNMNNDLGMPLSVLSAPRDTEVLILELGMNHPGEISRMSRCICPDIALITNIGTSHIGNLGSRENITKAKLEIADGMKNKNLIIPYGEELLKQENNAQTFSDASLSADYSIIKKTDSEIEFYEKGKTIFVTNFAFSEDHLLKCLACAIAATRKMKMNADEIKKGISLISDNNIRQNIVRAKNIVFFEDCYNSSLESVAADIKMMKKLRGYERKSIMLGDILELGIHSERIHREIGELISPSIFYSLYLFGNDARHIMTGALKAGFPKDRIFCNFTDNIDYSAKQLIENTVDNEIVLLKASRKMRLERVIEIVKSE